MYLCGECLIKQRKIDYLEEEVTRLKQKLRYKDAQIKEGYFGSGTPSSKKPFKDDNDCAKPKNNGGAKYGHKGHGRKTVPRDSADVVEYIGVGNTCPDCGGQLKSKGSTERAVIDSVPIKAKKIIYECEKKWCPKCRKTITKKPVVFPKFLYGNQLIAQALVLHYGHGLPMGRVESILGREVPSGSLYDVFHKMAHIFKRAMPKIVEEYRNEPVKHADETGWRNDGSSGCAWLFCSKNTSIFQFADTRSAEIAKSILGTRKLPGVLVVDRYSAYNKTPCNIQYCYAHLLRKVEDLGKQFMDDREVQCFVGALAPLLSEAMHLRSMNISDTIFYKKAFALKKKIIKVINTPAKHPGIIEVQTIFEEKKKRLYHWSNNRDTPADNNMAERELRPTVIARKISFGSQSDKGADTRSILMTVIHTAQKRLKNNMTLENWLKATLDKLSLDQLLDPYSLLPPRLA